MKTVALIFSILAALSCIISAEKVQITVEKKVDGCEYRAQDGDMLHTYYTAKFENGDVFSSNVGRSLYTFTLGAHKVIEGMEQGTIGMCQGEKRRLIIPSELAYGEGSDDGVIPPNSTLIFDFELVKIVRKDEIKYEL